MLITPSFLCFFHPAKMCNDVYGILNGNVHSVSGDTYPVAADSDESFLKEVITPIYEVLAKVNMIHQ